VKELNMPGLLKNKTLLLKDMSCQGICQEDIIEKFTRSSGPGGQNANKVSSCVYLKHIPTGIEIKCQRERSQLLNRYIARRLLAEKIRNLAISESKKQRQRLERIKRQERKRSRKEKLKILEAKRRRSEKKKLRRRPLINSEE